MECATGCLVHGFIPTPAGEQLSIPDFDPAKDGIFERQPARVRAINHITRYLNLH